MHKVEAALVGFPGSGKTVVFNGLTGQSLPVGKYLNLPHIEHGVFMLPDERLDALAKVEASPKVVPFHADVLDVTGLIDQEGSHAAVSDEVLNTIRNADVMVLVVRAFETPDHPGGPAVPEKELRTLVDELRFRDVALLEGRIERITAQVKKPIPNRDELEAEKDLCRNLLSKIESEDSINTSEYTEADQRILRGFQLFSLKPRVALINTSDETTHDLDTGDCEKAVFPAALEGELADLLPEEADDMRKELGLDSSLARELAKALRASLRMIHFYTSNEKEARTWALKAGSTALDAADVIHSDMAKGFIRAEVGQVDEIVQLGGLKEARKANILHQQGRDHEIRDGDYLLIRFSK